MLVTMLHVSIVFSHTFAWEFLSNFKPKLIYSDANEDKTSENVAMFQESDPELKGNTFCTHHNKNYTYNNIFGKYA